jgi:hypothetical protein
LQEKKRRGKKKRKQIDTNVSRLFSSLFLSLLFLFFFLHPYLTQVTLSKKIQTKGSKGKEDLQNNKLVSVSVGDATAPDSAQIAWC